MKRLLSAALAAAAALAVCFSLTGCVFLQPTKTSQEEQKRIQNLNMYASTLRNAVSIFLTSADSVTDGELTVAVRDGVWSVQDVSCELSGAYWQDGGDSESCWTLFMSDYLPDVKRCKAMLYIRDERCAAVSLVHDPEYSGAFPEYEDFEKCTYKGFAQTSGKLPDGTLMGTYPVLNIEL